MNKKEQKIYKVEEQATKTTTSFMHEQIMYIATNEVNLHSDLTEVAMALLNEFSGHNNEPRDSSSPQTFFHDRQRGREISPLTG